jgi:hypothetical protein
MRLTPEPFELLLALARAMPDYDCPRHEAAVRPLGIIATIVETIKGMQGSDVLGRVARRPTSE